MTIRSWTEFRYIVDGAVLITFSSEKEAREWANRCRALDPKITDKYVIKEVSIAEIPKQRFLV